MQKAADESGGSEAADWPPPVPIRASVTARDCSARVLQTSEGRMCFRIARGLVLTP